MKGEALGLAVIVELPLIVICVQRGGPSTGLPTKTEQADLLMAQYGRNGEAPMAILAPSTPSDCFATAVEAVDGITLSKIVASVGTPSPYYLYYHSAPVDTWGSSKLLDEARGLLDALAVLTYAHQT